MRIQFVVLSGLALILAGCGSDQPSSPRPGTLPGGTAVLTVNGQKLPASHAVACTFIQSTTTIKTGDDGAGSTVIVDNANGMQAQSVELRNLGGFTGSYWQDLGDAATVNVVDRTFTVTGKADGFDADNPSKRITSDFTVTASC